MASEYHATREAARTAMETGPMALLSYLFREIANFGIYMNRIVLLGSVSACRSIERTHRVIMLTSHA
jgi:hypothetical protein